MMPSAATCEDKLTLPARLKIWWHFTGRDMEGEDEMSHLYVLIMHFWVCNSTKLHRGNANVTDTNNNNNKSARGRAPAGVGWWSRCHITSIGLRQQPECKLKFDTLAANRPKELKMDFFSAKGVTSEEHYCLLRELRRRWGGMKNLFLCGDAMGWEGPS